MKRGWFDIPGVQRGPRTLREQLKGLQPLLDEIRADPDRSTVLDLGCAEGLISQACVQAGAHRVYGYDNNAGFIDQADALGLDPHRARFIVQDLNQAPGRDDHACAYSSIVLMLAILHKLREPEAMLRAWSELCSSLLVIRLPLGSDGAFVSKHHRDAHCDTRAVLGELGFALERDEPGPRGERVHYWRIHRSAGA